jgi:hypothetical protein
MLSRSDRVHVWLLERDRTALSRDFHREMIEARKPGGDPPEVLARYSFEETYATEQLEGIQTERLLARARALRIPLPSSRPHGLDPEKGDENWWLGSTFGEWLLTPEGEQRLRQSIRDEEKGRRESAAFWFGVWTTLLGVLAGLVGAFTGLVVVLRGPTP